jgi:RNA polymerase sigma-70 factor (ECF subfamily)
MKFEEIYKKYYLELKRFSVQLNSNAQEMDDVIQDIFLNFYKTIQTGIEIENPRAWLYKAMLNKLRTNFKSTQNHQLIEQEMVCKWEPHFDLIQKMEMDERKKIVFEIIEHLQPRDKELIILYYDGFSYTEIADITGIKYTSVGTTLLRTIQKIKNNLKTQYHEMFE